MKIHSNKNATFSSFQKEVDFAHLVFLISKSSFYRFKFYEIVQLPQIFPTIPKLLNFDKYLKSYSSL